MKTLPLLILLQIVSLIASCGSSIPESEIDDYVADKIQSDQVYDITVSPRYSRGNDLLQVVSYEQGDTLVMLSMEETTKDYYFYRSIYFNKGNPVYIEDYREEGLEQESVYSERKIYMTNGGAETKSYQKKTESSEKLDDKAFEEVNINMNEYDLNTYLDAVQQKNDFDMKFGEFIEVPGQTFLILENKESNYNAAYMILESDAFLDNLYSKQALFKGRSIMAYPQFRTIDNVDRMIYGGGELKK